MIGYSPSDGTLNGFTQDNLNNVQYALKMAKRKYAGNRSSYSGGALVVFGTTGNDNYKSWLCFLHLGRFGKRYDKKLHKRRYCQRRQNNFGGSIEFIPTQHQGQQISDRDR